MRIAVVLAVVGFAAPVGAEPVQPRPVYAPKGHPPGTGEAPFATPYLYVDYKQEPGANTGGAAARIVQADPALGAGDFHSLAEIAVENAGGQQIVEIGWTVDPGVNGDVAPHLFSFHWVDGQPTCYNGCGWVQVSTTHAPGMRVVPGEVHDYAIRLVNGDWWLFYDGEGIGYYPQSLWGGRFTQDQLTQWFGEVSAGSTSPCTEMGNGKPGGDAASASYDMLRVYQPDGTTAVPANASTGTVTNSLLYNIGRATPTSFGFGGPGAATGCCTPSSCVALSADCGAITDPKCGAQLACGECNDMMACSADHKCPGGFGPRDYAGVLDGVPVGPDAGTMPKHDGGGCCDASGGGTSTLLLGLLVIARSVRRRRPTGGCRPATRIGAAP